MTQTSSSQDSAPVLFSELAAGGGKSIGVATLNSPATLNGLSLPMCQALAARLKEWRDEPRIAAVVLSGAGDKAFCAGGDLQALYRSFLAEPDARAGQNTLVNEFFATEYRLDYAIHTYPKPVICWASGIVMGGGVGLMLGASHRVLTPTSRFAMPEISIGLFPDVAGTWMLGRMPRGIGLFMALSGAQLGAADCLHYGLADYFCAPDALEKILAALRACQWSASASEHHGQVDRLLAEASAPEPGAGPMQAHAGLLRELCGVSDLSHAASGLGSLAKHPEPWLARAANNFLAGAPGSARLGFELIERARHQSLAQAFCAEYIAALHCCAEPDFREGIRALLIDKDKQPRWSPATLAEATPEWVERFFQAPWPANKAHPLADLNTL